MRTHLIFGALLQVNNRYQLCRLASKATRLLHKPNNRLQDTTNDVLTCLNHQGRRMSRSPSKRDEAKPKSGQVKNDEKSIKQHQACS
jgi:hypothetical protein